MEWIALTYRVTLLVLSIGVVCGKLPWWLGFPLVALTFCFGWRKKKTEEVGGRT
jgi:hypothetical protein